MNWHTVRYDVKTNTVEIYRHSREYEDGEPLILAETELTRFGRSPEAADRLAAWLGRILLVDNREVAKAVGAD